MPKSTRVDTRPDKTVLYVEDEPVTSLYWKEQIEQQRAFNIISAGSLAQAAEFAGKSGMPDAILLDLCLPNGHGLSVIGSIRSMFDGIPIIVLTSYDFRADEVLAAGADDYARKVNTSPAEIETKLRDAIARREARLQFAVAKSKAESISQSIKELATADLHAGIANGR